MMVNIGSCEGLHLTSSINDKWYSRAINRLIGGLKWKDVAHPNPKTVKGKETEKIMFGG